MREAALLPRPAHRPARARQLSYGFFGGMGTTAGVTNFCGLHANVHGEIRQVVHGVADDLLDRMRRLGGLNEPHSVSRQDRRAGL